MPEENSTVGDAVAASSLVGAPVDERRPSHMSREEYLKKHPGRNTHQFLVDAGLKKEKKFPKAVLIALALAFIAGAAAVLLLR